MTISTVLTDEKITPERQRTIEGTLSDYLQRRGVHSLIRSIKAPDPFTGVERLVEAYGLGSLSPNTVLIGDSEFRVYLGIVLGIAVLMTLSLW